MALQIASHSLQKSMVERRRLRDPCHQNLNLAPICVRSVLANRLPSAPLEGTSPKTLLITEYNPLALPILIFYCCGLCSQQLLDICKA